MIRIRLREFQRRLVEKGHSLVGCELTFDNIRLRVIDENSDGDLSYYIFPDGVANTLRVRNWEIVRCYKKGFGPTTLEIK